MVVKDEMRGEMEQKTNRSADLGGMLGLGTWKYKALYGY